MKVLPLVLAVAFGFLNALLASDPLVTVSSGPMLSVFRLDTAKGELVCLSEREFESGGVQALSPSRELLYLGTHLDKEPAIATLRVDPSGALEVLDIAPSEMSPGDLTSDGQGRFLAGSNYREGRVQTWKLDREGIFRGEIARKFTLEKKAHCARFSPDNRFLFVPATGPNKIFQLVFNQDSGEVVPNQPSSAPALALEGEAQQPRHLVFHPTLPVAYSTMESGRPGAAVWDFEPSTGLLAIQTTHPTAEPGAVRISTADLHVSPDGRFLYISNRDGLDRKSPTGRDVITLFSIDPESGGLTLEKQFGCERIPRSFAITPAGDFLVVGGQGDSRLGTYRIDPKTGYLQRNQQIELPGSPRWVGCFLPPTTE